MIGPAGLTDFVTIPAFTNFSLIATAMAVNIDIILRNHLLAIDARHTPPARCFSASIERLKTRGREHD